MNRREKAKKTQLKDTFYFIKGKSIVEMTQIVI